MKTSVKRAAISFALMSVIIASCSSDSGAPAQPAPAPAPAPEAPVGVDELADARAFFEGKRVRIVVVYGPGGAFDLISRTIAPTVGEYLNANVVVENLPGAGGILAMNTVWEEEPDGLTVVFFSGQGVTGSVLGGADGVQFDLLDFEYVARIAAEPRIMMRSLTTSFTDATDLIGASGLRFASSGPGGSDHIDANVLFDALGIDGSIITGYSGSAETALAVASGDVDVASGTLLDRARTISAGDALPLLIIGDSRVDLYPDIPHVLELDLDAEARDVIQAQLGLQGMGYTMLAPPGTPRDRVQVLTDAFEFAMTDEGALGRLAEQNLVREGFLRGDDLRAIAVGLLQDAPERFREVLLRAYAR
jgi:tripartite-type tricarboxylate transporter receptor subunit TctC